jgi:hypothetical protein
MNTRRQPSIYMVQLQSAQHGDGAVHTLRAALKVLLRRFRLRRISIEERDASCSAKRKKFPTDVG